MTIEFAIHLFQNLIMTCFTVITPILGSAIVIGLTVSILQTVTSIQEQSLVFVPKLVGVGMVLIIISEWMLVQIVNYTQEMFMQMANMAS